MTIESAVIVGGGGEERKEGEGEREREGEGEGEGDGDGDGDADRDSLNGCEEFITALFLAGVAAEMRQDVGRRC